MEKRRAILPLQTSPQEKPILMHRKPIIFHLLPVAILVLSACKQQPASAPAENAPPSEVVIASPSPSPNASRPSGPIEYTDVSAPAGIRFKHNSGAFGKKYLPETMGNGGAFLDYDNDGWQDILLVNSASWPEQKSVRSPAAVPRSRGATGS